MAPDECDLPAILEDHLAAGLSVLGRAAEQMEACSVSVVVFGPGDSVRMVYNWPGEGAAPGTLLPAGPEVVALLERLEEPGLAAEAVARWFGRASASKARSFLLLPWPEKLCKVVIAFGYASETPIHPAMPDEISAALRLAALATWAVPETRRLRRDLRVVNERLRQRKTVERAKGMLQDRHGWSEQRAYEHLRRLSRERRKTLADTAEDLLRVFAGT